MNILLSTIGRRGYIADFFRESLNIEDKIYGSSNSIWTSGLLHCDEGLLLPDIQSKSYIPKMLQVCKEKKINILISLFDPDTRKIVEHIKEFEKLQVFHLIPTKAIVEICFDKFLTFAFLKENNFNTPETFVDIKDAEKAINNKEINYPLIIKPRYGYGSRNVYKADNYKQLDAFFSLEQNMIIQEYLYGIEYHLDVFNDNRGNIISVIPKKKITMRAGETDKALVIKDKRIIDFAIELSGKLKHIGNLDVDLFLNNDKLYVLEMNTRFGGGYPLSHFAGVNLLDLVIKMAKGEKILPIIGRFKEGSYFMKEPGFVNGKYVNLTKKFSECL